MTSCPLTTASLSLLHSLILNDSLYLNGCGHHEFHILAAWDQDDGSQKENTSSCWDADVVRFCLNSIQFSRLRTRNFHCILLPKCPTSARFFSMNFIWMSSIPNFLWVAYVFTCTYSREVAVCHRASQGIYVAICSTDRCALAYKELLSFFYCLVCMLREKSLQPMRTKLIEAINSVYYDYEQIKAILTLGCNSSN